MVSIKRAHLIIGFVIMVGAPVLTSVRAYDSALASIRETYVKRDDMAKLQEKIDRIAEDVAEIKGELKQHR